MGKQSEESSGAVRELEEGTSLWRDAWRRLRKNYAAMAGAGVVSVMAVAAVGYEVASANITHFTIEEQHAFVMPKPPGTRTVPSKYFTLLEPVGEYAFDKIDANGDELIEDRELVAAYQRMEFATLDRDGDGALNYEEYADAPLTLEAQTIPSCEQWAMVKRSMAPVEHPQVFACESGSVDGTLSPEQAERVTAIVAVGEARTIISRFDEDEDLFLSPKEYEGLPRPETNYLGTDKLGRDLLTRLIYGARISLAVGLLATLVSFLIGVSWGATAGFAGGKVDNLMMRVVDIMYGLPFMFLVILLMTVFGQNIWLLFVALGAIQWLTMARIVRGQVISLKGQEFVEAARCIGVSNRSIIFRHLIPNALGPIIVYATLTVPAVMLEEAFLSFLGLGVQAPRTSWGALASEGRQYMESAPWLILWPGLALAATLLSLNFLGDGLRDALDPQLRKE